VHVKQELSNYGEGQLWLKSRHEFKTKYVTVVSQLKFFKVQHPTSRGGVIFRGWIQTSPNTK